MVEEEEGDGEVDGVGKEDEEESVSEYSVVGEMRGADRFIDANFTLDFGKENAFRKDDVKLQSQVSKSQLSIEFNALNLQ